MIGRNDACWCGSGKKWKKCHYPSEGSGIRIKTPEQIEGIRRACQLAAKILDALCKKAVAGSTTNELNEYAETLHREARAVAAPLGYGFPPFPKSICTSLNEVICHGIPDDRPLQDGDILNIDVTCILNGYFGDTSRMVTIGAIDADKKRVVDVSHECLMRAIKILKPGIPLNMIGETIQSYAEAHGCSVVTQFVGHGVGLAFHEPPQVAHHRTPNDTPLVPGMIFTIEPMINAGRFEAVVDPVDHWTARTIDGKPSAQWEHTLLITPTGYEILTSL
ncbi:MAG: methionyl aminopeptidase [Verrucomicrobia bacterium]|nr:methionyl aminopeptidase [Verrucomicrobiota bacterium]MBS0637868.1 methionyl aminopeptidase [Verrucomicrobiota bacterium]